MSGCRCKEMKMIIRKETTDDVSAIETVTRQAFLNVQYSSHTEQFIVRALREADALTISLVAEIEQKVVGHVAVSPVRVSDGSSDWYGLGPISVMPDQQKMGIGSQLMRTALDELQDIGASACVLLGNPDYYQRFGFKPASNLILSGVPALYFQVLSFHGSMAQGEVTYHDAFNALE